MNRVQQRIFYAGARDLRVLAARRFGKTDGVLGPRLWAVAQTLPQGAGAFLGASRKQLYSRTIPGVIAALERFYGFKEGVHFGWGKPPKGTPPCIIRPKSYENAMWFANGHLTHALSLATLGSANGMTLCYVDADECKFLPKQKIDEEVMPANSGIVHPLGDKRFSEDNPYYKSTCFVSDASLTNRGNWLSKEEDVLEQVIDHGEMQGKTYREVQAELDEYADRVMYFNEMLRSAKKGGHRVQVVSADTRERIRGIAAAVEAREGGFRIVPRQYQVDNKHTVEMLLAYKLIDEQDAERARHGAGLGMDGNPRRIEHGMFAEKTGSDERRLVDEDDVRAPRFRLTVGPLKKDVLLGIRIDPQVDCRVARMYSGEPEETSGENLPAETF